jgi:HD superfamily phosphodiesterase
VIALSELIASEAERAALHQLREATGAVDTAMERHCLRCRHIAARVAAKRRWVIDGEVLTVAALLHDIGLYPRASAGGVYTADGALLARRLLAGLGWSQERIELCARAIDRHHDVRGQLALGTEVEALRRADLIDVSGGLVRFGIERDWLQRLFAAIPRNGLYRELARELRRAARERPTTLPRIFLRPSE